MAMRSQLLEMLKMLLILGVIILIWAFLSSITHEFCHYLGFRILGYKAKIRLPILRGRNPYVECESSFLTKKQAVVLLLLPLIIKSIIYLIMLIVFPKLRIIFLTLLVLNILCCSSDIERSVRIGKIKEKDILISTSGNFLEVYEKYN